MGSQRFPGGSGPPRCPGFAHLPVSLKLHQSAWKTWGSAVPVRGAMHRVLEEAPAERSIHGNMKGGSAAQRRPGFCSRPHAKGGGERGDGVRWGGDCGRPPEGGESGGSGVHQLQEGVGSLPCGPPRRENPCPVCDCEGEDDLLESGPVLACWFLWKKPKPKQNQTAVR